MSLFHLIWRSLAWYWRTGIVVVFGTAVAAAALVGSLVIGASVTGSLRATALARLGTISHALVAPRDLRAGLAGELAANTHGTVVPLYLTAGAVTHVATEVVIPHVNVIGVDDDFWMRYPATGVTVSGRRAAMNAALARDLGASVEDTCLVTVGRSGALASDLLFAQRRREETRRRLRVTVSGILPDHGPGGFTLAAGSAVPRNLFVSRKWLLMMLDKGDVANALALSPAGADVLADSGILRKALTQVCTLDDYGLKLVSNPELDYLAVQSTGMVLNTETVAAVQRAVRQRGTGDALQFAGVSRMSIYLAKTIRHGERRTAYALLAGVAHEVPYRSQRGQFNRNTLRPLGDDGIWLNAWAAQDLGAHEGDTVTLDYLVPSADGTYGTQRMRFTVCGVLTMTGLATDRMLTPVIEGVTDANRIDAWQAPFPVEMALVTPRDDDYWAQYGIAPKAFVSLTAMQKMWAAGPEGARTDYVTAMKLDTQYLREPYDRFFTQFRRQLLQTLTPEDAGLTFRPVREQALQAAKGSTDFAQLFLAMSLFLVAAAAGLAGMLMRLLAERRAAEAGLLLATGYSARTVRRAIIGEGAVLSLLGTLLGLPLGVLYAWAVLRGLTSWWRGAVGDMPLWLHVDAGTLGLGALCGLGVGLWAVAWGARTVSRRPVLALLAGWQGMAAITKGSRRPVIWAAITLLGAAALLIAAGVKGISATGAFFGGGTLLLIGGLCAASAVLARVQTQPLIAPAPAALALRNIAVNRGRSLLVVGLLASAAFLLVTVAANGRDLSRMDPRRRDAGTGGFSLRAISTLPLLYDLNTPAGRANLGFAPEDEATFADVTIIGLRMSPGDDISCLNLARPAAPRVLGVPAALIARNAFRVHTPRALANPWQALQGPGDDIPAFADAESLEWTLHSGVGKRFDLRLPTGVAPLRFTGTLEASLFGGEVLVAEARFAQLFPGTTAPRYFLIDTPPGRAGAMAGALRRTLGEDGLEVRDTREVLNSFLGVQNAYLAIFLALGGLGMVLGTVGLLVILLRNALERRREFALMLATGYRREALAALLLREYGWLLAAGLGGGTLTALLAVLPQLLSRGARIPWPVLLAMLAAMAGVGLISCVIAARLATRGEILAGLRDE